MKVYILKFQIKKLITQTCRMLTRKERKFICLKPKNNSIWVDSGEGICFKKLSKPKLKLKDITKDSAVFELEIDQKIDLNFYDMILNLDEKSF